MIRRIAVAFAACGLLSMAAAAQQDAGVSGKVRTDSATSKTTAKISGRVSNDGKTFADTEGVVWSVINSDAVAENLGGHVVLRARLDSGKHEIEVVSVRIDTVAAARLHDAAFRR